MKKDGGTNKPKWFEWKMTLIILTSEHEFFWEWLVILMYENYKMKKE